MRGNTFHILWIIFAIAVAILIVVAFLPKDVEYLTPGNIERVAIVDPKRLESDEIIQMKEAIRKQRALLDELSCKSNNIGARGGFCLTTTNLNVGYNYIWDITMSVALENGILKDASVGDFGAGLGWYGRFWERETREKILYNSTQLENDVFLKHPQVQEAFKKTPKMIREWEGFDGAGNVETLSGGFIKFLDLSEPQSLPRKYDWIVSLEVGEHIPAEYEDIFIQNLDAHACYGIVLSWAVEGQGGHFHVNCKNNDYVKKKFAERGFTNDIETENQLRAIASQGHFKNTVMVFKRNVAQIGTGCHAG